MAHDRSDGWLSTWPNHGVTWVRHEFLDGGCGHQQRQLRCLLRWATMGQNSGSDPVVLAQLTIATADYERSGTATSKAQGRSSGGAEDWDAALAWSWPDMARPPPPPALSMSAGAGVTVVATDGVAGFTTVRLTLTLTAEQENVYSLFGEPGATISMPPAFQVAAPFGTDYGGANPALFALMPESEFDSWLTVGTTTGDSRGDMSSIGIDFASWSATAGLNADNGASFWMAPDDAPGGSDPIVMAQLTIDNEAFAGGGEAIAAAQGHSAGSGEDWSGSYSWCWPGWVARA